MDINFNSSKNPKAKELIIRLNYADDLLKNK